MKYLKKPSNKTEFLLNLLDVADCLTGKVGWKQPVEVPSRLQEAPAPWPVMDPDPDPCEVCNDLVGQPLRE